jgi:hypothetical protein
MRRSGIKVTDEIGRERTIPPPCAETPRRYFSSERGVAVLGHLAIAVRRGPVQASLILLISIAWAGAAHAQTGPTIVCVEEDWELTIGTPDPDLDAPQVMCVMSPVGNVNSAYAAFELNAQSLPVFTPGGLQLQTWEGELAVSDRRFPNGSVMATPGEVVHWTQSMKLSGGQLTFEITNGSSTTWGSFGGQGYLKSTVGTSLSSLNAYDPAVSVKHSGVAYAGNRVQSLVLKRVRAVTATGEEVVDTTQRVVHSQP